MDNEKLREYYSIYTDCWKLFKEFSNPPKSGDPEEDCYWNRLTDMANDVYEKHGKSIIVKEIILATMDEAERISKGKVLEQWRAKAKDVELEELRAIPAD